MDHSERQPLLPMSSSSSSSSSAAAAAAASSMHAPAAVPPPLLASTPQGSFVDEHVPPTVVAFDAHAQPAAPQQPHYAPGVSYQQPQHPQQQHQQQAHRPQLVRFAAVDSDDDALVDGSAHAARTQYTADGAALAERKVIRPPISNARQWLRQLRVLTLKNLRVLARRPIGLAVLLLLPTLTVLLMYIIWRYAKIGPVSSVGDIDPPFSDQNSALVKEMSRRAAQLRHTNVSLPLPTTLAPCSSYLGPACTTLFVWPAQQIVRSLVARVVTRLGLSVDADVVFFDNATDALGEVYEQFVDGNTAAYEYAVFWETDGVDPVLDTAALRSYGLSFNSTLHEHALHAAGDDVDALWSAQERSGRLLALKRAIDIEVMAESDVFFDVEEHVASFTDIAPDIRGEIPYLEHRVMPTPEPTPPPSPGGPTNPCAAYTNYQYLYEETRDQTLVVGVAPTLLLLGVMVPASYFLTLITGEKRAHLVGVLRKMGASDGPLLLSWLLPMVLVSIVSTLLATAVMKMTQIGAADADALLVWKHTSFDVLFFTYLGASLWYIGFFLLFAAMMQRPLFVNAFIIFMGLLTLTIPPTFAFLELSGGATLYLVVDDDDGDGGCHLVRGMFETAFQNRAAQFFSIAMLDFPLLFERMYSTTRYPPFESVTWSELTRSSAGEFSVTFQFSIDKMAKGGSGALALSMLYVTLVIGTLMAWYLMQAMASELDGRRPPFFLFSASYWTGGVTRDQLAIALQRDNATGSSQGWESQLALPDRLQLESLRQADIRLHKLSKTFKKTGSALKEVSMSMNFGEVFALLGHNGAGKTTMINIVGGLLEPTHGEAFVQGFSVRKHNAEIQQSIGVCPQFDVTWPELTAAHHLELAACLHRMHDDDIPDAVRSGLASVDLAKEENNYAQRFSGGMRRRLTVAMSSVGDYRVWVLDEPTTGMDVVNKKRVWRIIEEKKKDRVVILTTHSMEEADALGDRIGILHNGTLRALGTSLFLKNEFGSGYQLTLLLSSEDLTAAVKQTLFACIPGCSLVDETVGRLTVSLDKANIGKLPLFFATVQSMEAEGTLPTGTLGSALTGEPAQQGQQAQPRDSGEHAAPPAAAGGAQLKPSLDHGDTTTTTTTTTAVATTTSDASSSMPTATAAKDNVIREWGISNTTLEEVFLRLCAVGEQAVNEDTGESLNERFCQLCHDRKAEPVTLYTKGGIAIRVQNVVCAQCAGQRSTEQENDDNDDNDDDDDDDDDDDVVDDDDDAGEKKKKRRDRSSLLLDDTSDSDGAAIDRRSSVNQPLDPNDIEDDEKRALMRGNGDGDGDGDGDDYYGVGGGGGGGGGGAYDKMRATQKNKKKKEGAKAGMPGRHVWLQLLAVWYKNACSVLKSPVLFVVLVLFIFVGLLVMNLVPFSFDTNNDWCENVASSIYGGSIETNTLAKRWYDAVPVGGLCLDFVVFANLTLGGAGIQVPNTNDQTPQPYTLDDIFTLELSNTGNAPRAGEYELWMSDQSDLGALGLNASWLTYDNRTTEVSYVDVTERVVNTSGALGSGINALVVDGQRYIYERGGPVPSNATIGSGVRAPDPWTIEDDNRTVVYNLLHRLVPFSGVGIEFACESPLVVGARSARSVEANFSFALRLMGNAYNRQLPNAGDYEMSNDAAGVWMYPYSNAYSLSSVTTTTSYYVEVLDLTYLGAAYTCGRASTWADSCYYTRRLVRGSLNPALFSQHAMHNWLLAAALDAQARTDPSVDTRPLNTKIVPGIGATSYMYKQPPVMLYPLIVFLPVMLNLMFLPWIVFQFVRERELRLVEHLYITGLHPVYYFVGQCSFYAVMVLIPQLLLVIVGKAAGQSLWDPLPPGFYFVNMLVWPLNLVALSVFTSSLFSGTRSAIAFSCFFTLALIAAAVVILLPFPPKNSMPLVLGLLPPLAQGRSWALMFANARHTELGVLQLLQLISAAILFVVGALINVRRTAGFTMRAPWHKPVAADGGSFTVSPPSPIDAETPAGDSDDDVFAEFERVRGRERSFAVCLQGLGKQYADGKLAVSDVTMGLEYGQIFGLLGPNGAGKSTMLSILSGALESTFGRALINGVDITDSAFHSLHHLGICPQDNLLWPELTVKEHITMFQLLKGTPVARLKPECYSGAATVNLDGDAFLKKSGDLSGGQKRRLAMALSLTGRPRVLLMDEISTGLDPKTRSDLWKLVRAQAGAGRLIVLTTHSMEEADALSNRIGIMMHGRLRCIGSPLELKRRYGSGYTLTVVTMPPSAAARRGALPGQPGARAADLTTSLVSPEAQAQREVRAREVRVREERLDNFVVHSVCGGRARLLRRYGRCQVYLIDTLQDDIGVLFRRLESKKTKKQYGIRDWEITMSSLEDVFFQLYMEGKSDDEADQLLGK